MAKTVSSDGLTLPRSIRPRLLLSIQALFVDGSLQDVDAYVALYETGHDEQGRCRARSGGSVSYVAAGLSTKPCVARAARATARADQAEGGAT
jgi:nicotinamidase-related amidase